MKNLFVAILFCFASAYAKSQELYVFTEPASNMPAHSATVKFSSVFGDRGYSWQRRYTPELMLGINKKLMFHTGTSFSNMHTPAVKWESAYLYGKYRFLSKDEVHQHFRMAAFAEGSYSKNEMVFDEISLAGDASGVQGGIIATQLINKLALSASASYLHLIYDKESEEHQQHSVDKTDKALNYTASAGYLVLPRAYKSFRQLNVNIYTEFLAQQALNKEAFFLDAAPAIQFIFNSNSKINLGYRFQLTGNATRSAKESYLVSFEHTFLNALKSKGIKKPAE